MRGAPCHQTISICLAIALTVILAVVVAIAKFKLHPFPALMIGALVLGLWTGADPAQILKSFRTGFGEALANVGVLLALGAMFGELLASSGGAGARLQRAAARRRHATGALEHRRSGDAAGTAAVLRSRRWC